MQHSTLLLILAHVTLASIKMETEIVSHAMPTVSLALVAQTTNACPADLTPIYLEAPATVIMVTPLTPTDTAQTVMVLVPLAVEMPTTSALAAETLVLPSLTEFVLVQMAITSTPLTTVNLVVSTAPPVKVVLTRARHVSHLLLFPQVSAIALPDLHLTQMETVLLLAAIRLVLLARALVSTNVSHVEATSITVLDSATALPDTISTLAAIALLVVLTAVHAHPRMCAQAANQMPTFQVLLVCASLATRQIHLAIVLILLAIIHVLPVQDQAVTNVLAVETLLPLPTAIAHVLQDITWTALVTVSPVDFTA